MYVQLYDTREVSGGDGNCYGVWGAVLAEFDLYNTLDASLDHIVFTYYLNFHIHMCAFRVCQAHADTVDVSKPRSHQPLRLQDSDSEVRSTLHGLQVSLYSSDKTREGALNSLAILTMPLVK